MSEQQYMHNWHIIVLDSVSDKVRTHETYGSGEQPLTVSLGAASTAL